MAQIRQRLLTAEPDAAARGMLLRQEAQRLAAQAALESREYVRSEMKGDGSL